MGNNEFVKLVKNAVMYTANEMKTVDPPITTDDVYIVWIAKVLQNNKALAAVDREDGMYYEATFNGNRDEMYLDVYHKVKNIVIDCRQAPGHVEDRR